MRTPVAAILLLLPALLVLAPPLEAVPATDPAWDVEWLRPPVGARSAATVYFSDAAWQPGGNLALIVGGIRGPLHNPCEGWSFMMTYDGSAWDVVYNQTGCILYRMDWAPDGTHALIVGEHNTVLKYTPATKAITNLWSTSSFAAAGDTFLPRNVAYRPDGSYALLTGNDILRYYAVEPVTGARDVIRSGLHGAGDFYDSVAWSPDSRYAILESGVTDAGNTRATGAVSFWSEDAEMCAKHGLATTPCVYARALYGRHNAGFTDIDGITFGPLGKVAWIYGNDGGSGTIMRYGEQEDGFSYPYRYTHESARITSMAWQPNAFKVLWTGFGDKPVFMSEGWRFSPVIDNPRCAEILGGTDHCPQLKKAVWHPSGKWAFTIGGPGWIFRFTPTLAPTLEWTRPTDNEDLSGSSAEAKGVAVSQQLNRAITHVDVRVDGGEWKPAELGRVVLTRTQFNYTIDLANLTVGARHLLEARASDDNRTSWGNVAPLRFYVKTDDPNEKYERLQLRAVEGTTVANGFNLSWDNLTHARYVLERSAEPTFISATPFHTSDPGTRFLAHAKGTWYFRVAAFGGLNQGDWSNTVAVTVTTGPVATSGQTDATIPPPPVDQSDPPPPQVNDTDPKPRPPPEDGFLPGGFRIPGPAVLLILLGALAVAFHRRPS